jgi:hypothetical protein
MGVSVGTLSRRTHTYPWALECEWIEPGFEGVCKYLYGVRAVGRICMQRELLYASLVVGQKS